MREIANQRTTERDQRRSMPVTRLLARFLERRPLVVVYAAVGLAALIGWLYLGAMIAAMVPAMDMADLGPGMQVFNQFGGFSDLPANVRAAIAALCLPGYATTFGMADAGSWGFSDLALVYVMWVMMVLAMMLPSAAPMLASYGERMAGSARGPAAVLLLAAGYLSVWCVYSFAATGLQWALHEAQLATVMMVPATTTLAATTLIAAGFYQFTAAKRACLTRCQKPYPGLCSVSGPKEGEGAYRAGLRQGLDCMGCCWALMAVMFAVGVMNILWIALLGVVMVIEKTQPHSSISPAIGVALIAWGGALLAVGGPLSAFF